jgi:hypothetical protein
MKNLPLLLLGAGAVYFIAKKPGKVSTSTKEDSTGLNQIGSEKVGYKIVEQKFGVSKETHFVITVYNRQQALDYAYNTGIKYANNGPGYVANLLIGSQFDLLRKLNLDQDFKFVFDLLVYGYSGMSSVIKNKEFDDKVLNLLNQFVLDMINLGLTDEEFLKYFKVSLL